MPTIHDFADAARDFPNGYYTLLAALVAFVGVWLSLWGHSKRERNNRLADIRRGVFLEAAEQLGRARVAISRFPHFGIADSELGAHANDYGTCIAKVYLVAHTETIEHLANFDLQLAAITGTLVQPRSHLMELKTLRDRANERLLEMDRQTKTIMESGRYQTPDAINEWNNKREVLVLEAYKCHQELLAASMRMYHLIVEPSRLLGKLQADTVNAMREEMELGERGGKYREVIHSSIDKECDGLNALFSALEGTQEK